ncbi:MAG TPA: MFS transporter [Verrucomicrobiales bacterium]|nr:MFS transporter [Verrucomicrobiales bacterium]
MTAWSPLRLPLFRALWLSSVVSNIGSTMNDTAAVWTMGGMVTLDRVPVMTSLMQTMSSLPLFLLGLPAGALADLVDRKRLIMTAQIGALSIATGMAAMAWLGALNPGTLLLATFLLGVASTFTMPAMQALVPEVVGKPQLSSAIALNSVGFNIARAIGPVAGGLLVARFGPVPVFTLNALSFVAMVLVMGSGKYPSIPRSAQREQMLGAMSAAIRYARHAPAMRAVLFRGGMHMFAAVAPVVLLPFLVRARGWDGTYFGTFMSCYGAGAILMAVFVLPKLRARFSFDQVLAGASVVSALVAAALGLEPGAVVIGLILAVAGASWMSGLNTFSVASQSAFPNWVRARSSAIYLVVMQGAFAIGSLTWGYIAGHFNAPVALFAASAGLLFSGFLTRVIPISHVDKLDLTPSGHWHEHHFTNEPAPSDGPVLITIEYHIDPEDARAFRAAMFHLRKTRLRDGAFRCSMFSDIEDPTHYRETFLVGSWAEHLRQHARATVEDQRIEQAVLDFHRGPAPPRIRHFLMINLRDPIV